MSQAVPPPTPDWAASVPEWHGTGHPGTGHPRTAHAGVTSGAWTPPSPSGPPVVVPPPGPARGRLAVGFVAAVSAVAGAVAGVVLTTAVFMSSAEAIGEGIAVGLVSEGVLGGPMSEGDYGWTAGPPVDPADVEQPVPPVTGADPVLDAYGQSCFEADYQSCDALFFESPPMSDYEEYGSTCGGRVKIGAVMSCTELE